MGWQNAFHCEIDDFCNTILNYWFKDAKSYTDVTTTDFREWRGKINVLTGGFPCQPFSVAGQRKGADDNRYLWPHMLRAIHEIRPDWVIGENVAGILTMVQPGQETEVGSQSTLFGFKDNVAEFDAYVASLNKPVQKIISDYHVGGTGNHYSLNIFSEIPFYRLSLYISYLQMFSFGLNTHGISRF